MPPGPSVDYQPLPKVSVGLSRLPEQDPARTLRDYLKTISIDVELPFDRLRANVFSVIASECRTRRCVF